MLTELGMGPMGILCLFKKRKKKKKKAAVKLKNIYQLVIKLC